MRFLILSDLHANWEALSAVLEDAKGEFDKIICCGDLVGYNPDPVSVVVWAAQNCSAVVRGNHDKACADSEELDWFNPVARQSIQWTVSQLSQKQIQYLAGLPQGPVTVDQFQICHGAPLDEDEYLISPADVEPQVDYLDAPLTFFGHTHLQGGFLCHRRSVKQISKVPAEEREQTVMIEPHYSYLINPGSVGQPRDGDPRAAYALYDTSQSYVLLRRVSYPVNETLNKILQAGLPEKLATRLLRGI